MTKRHLSDGNFAEHERSTQQLETESPAAQYTEEQMFLDYLIEAGFSGQEAVKLMALRTHLYENAEMRQRVTDDCRMHFARWLYEQGEITEEEC